MILLERLPQYFGAGICHVGRNQVDFFERADPACGVGQGEKERLGGVS